MTERELLEGTIKDIQQQIFTLEEALKDLDVQILAKKQRLEKWREKLKKLT